MRTLHRDPALAAYLGIPMGVGDAATGDSGNDWRGPGALDLAVFMPKLHAELGGRYGAFLFMTYAVVLAIAELVTLRAQPGP